MKNLKEESIEYSERHQDVSGVLGKYLVSAVFQDGANSNWVKSEKIKAQIEAYNTALYTNLQNAKNRLTQLEKQLKELEQ